jgi:hypothetical protein
MQNTVMEMRMDIVTVMGPRVTFVILVVVVFKKMSNNQLRLLVSIPPSSL